MDYFSIPCQLAYVLPIPLKCAQPLTETAVVCLPLELNWKPFAGISGKCINILKLFYTVSVTDIITDGMFPLPAHSFFSIYIYINHLVSDTATAVILTLPWPQILKLQMSRTRKIQILGIFSLGFFVVIAGIVRTIKPPVNSKAEKERLTKATEAKEKIAGGDSPKKEIKEKAPK